METGNKVLPNKLSRAAGRKLIHPFPLNLEHVLPTGTGSKRVKPFHEIFIASSDRIFMGNL